MNELKKYLDNKGSNNITPAKKVKRLPSIIFTFLLTAIVIGGGVFFSQKILLEEDKNKSLDNLQNSFQEQITVLTNKIENLEKEEEEAKEEEGNNNFLTYINEDVGFSFQYPSSINLIDEATWSTGLNTQELSMSVIIDNITNMPDNSPWWLSKQGAIDDMNALEDGQFNDVYGFPLASSENIIDIGGQNAKKYLRLGSLESCDIFFEKTLIFYNNNYRVNITLYGPVDSIVNSIDWYLTTPEGCGDKKTWTNDKQGIFYTLLLNTNAPFAAQNWFGTFETIISSINIAGFNYSYNNEHPLDLIPTLVESFAYNHGIDAEGISINILQSTTDHLKGQASIAGQNILFLAHKGNGDWSVIQEGSNIMCSDIFKFGFPFYMISDCLL